jgi:hypothetical protein
VWAPSAGAMPRTGEVKDADAVKRRRDGRDSF